MNNKKYIEVNDFGAGSQHHKGTKRQIRDIARTSLSSAKQGQLLFRLVNYFQPQYILETGTSFGISTLYLGMANTKNKVYTIEACSQISQIAQNNFNKINATNIKLYNAPIDRVLPQILSKVNKLDLIFLDANHRLAPTLTYFEQCLSKCKESTVFVIDDIHWSPEMNDAWQSIQAHKQVNLSIDLFFCGLVFLKKRAPKQHFILKY